MQSKHLEYVLTLAQTGSMSKVAHIYGISQPALSRAISHLETELGYPLFHRNNHGVVLTTLGRQVLPAINKLHTDYERLKILRPLNLDLPSTTVDLACYPTASATIMLDILSSLKDTAPHTLLAIHQVSSSAVLDMVWQGHCQIGISGEPLESYSEIVQSAKQKGLLIKVLYTDDFTLLLSPQHPIAHWPEIHLNHILNQPFAAYKDFFLNHTHPFSKFTNTYGFSDYENVKKLVAENKAIAYLPKLLLYKDVYFANHLIINRPLIDYQLQLVNYLIYPKTLPINAAIQLLLEIISQCYSQLRSEVQ